MTLLECGRLSIHPLSYFRLLLILLGSFRYVEKRWASQGEFLAALKSADPTFNLNESPEVGAKSGIQKNRRLSLDESILVDHMARIRPPVAKPLEVFILYIKLPL